MPADRKAAQPQQRKYQFVTAVSITALEASLNTMAAQNEEFTLRQILYVQGSGFVAALEREEDDAPPQGDPESRQQKRKTSR